MKKIPWEALWEAGKEPLRLFLLALIPIALAQAGTLKAEWAVVLVFILRFLDKLLHEWGKETKNPVLERGITQF